MSKKRVAKKVGNNLDRKEQIERIMERYDLSRADAKRVYKRVNHLERQMVEAVRTLPSGG